MSGAITQSGPVADGHVAVFVKNGVVEDGGPASNGVLSEVGITNDGALALGINAGAVSGPYVQYGVSVASNGTITVSANGFNGAPGVSLVYDINGVTYGFPGPGFGDVSGPSSAANENLASFNGTTGTLIQDSGIPKANVVTATGGAAISAAMVPVVEAAATPAALAGMGAPQYLTDIAALRALTSAAQPTSNFVMGYTTIGDGGGGLYAYVASDTTSSDNGGTIIVDAASRRWYLATNDGPLNIMQFGGVADGTTDNTTAFVNALGALPAEGGSIYFPRGNFAFTGQIAFTFLNYTASLEIAGAGKGATILTFPNTSGGILINYVIPGSSQGNGFGSANNVKIHDMTFATGKTGGANGITLNMSGNQAGSPSSGLNEISNVGFRGSDGILKTEFWTIEIDIIGVSNVNLIGIVGYSTTTRADGTGVRVSGTSTNIPVAINAIGCMWNNEKIGIDYGAYAQGIAAIGCNFVGHTFGIVAQTGLPSGQQVELIVTGCQFNCFGACIAAQSVIVAMMITGNLFFVESGSSNSAITFEGCEGFTITGNYLLGVGNGIGIFINDNTGGRGGMITGNSIGGFTSGIDLEAGSGGVNVQSNQYFSNTANVLNNGTGNTIGGGSE